MIKAKDTPSKTTQEVELLGEERQRLGRIERQLIDGLRDPRVTSLSDSCCEGMPRR
jgi:hypothetical protein